MDHFTPVSALAGGLLIGLASVLLLLANGRIAGISGIMGGLLRGSTTDRGWRFAFIAGLLLAPLLLRAVGWETPDTLPQTGMAGLVCAGLLVGCGTRIAGGCTSGHGVCGLSRLSARSIAATLCFTATAMLTVFAMRHLME